MTRALAAAPALLLALAAAAAPAPARAAPDRWTIDAAHTQASFEVLHLAIATYRGEFARTGGAVVLDDERPEACSAEATIDAASIRTREAAWDARLRSPEFLDAERYPVITFRSTAVVRAAIEVHGRDDELGKYRVSGLLTLHGITHPVVLAVTVTPTVKDPAGRLRRASGPRRCSIGTTTASAGRWRPGRSSATTSRSRSTASWWRPPARRRPPPCADPSPPRHPAACPHALRATACAEGAAQCVTQRTFCPRRQSGN